MPAMERKHHLLIGIALIVIIAAILISSTPPLPSTEGPVKHCGPNRCRVAKYRRNESSCKCVFIGLGDQRAEETYPEADPAGETAYTSFSKACNLELSDRNLLMEGVNTVRWLSDSLMEVNAIATANCASGIRSSGVKMKGNAVTLWYSLPTITQGDPSARCECGHELVYWIEGLDWRGQYDITFQELT